MNYLRKLTMEEILNLTPKDLSIFDDAYKAGAKFAFGVDHTKLGLRLTINYRPHGIYLHENVAEFRTTHTGLRDAVITPDQVKAGEFEGDVWNDINIYVDLQEYNQFTKDASSIWELFHKDGLCFRGIPELWFSHLTLVQFIRDRLQPNPIMAKWFKGGISATSRWLTPPLED